MSVTPAKMNPFPGLRPFTQEEDYLFFGREEQTLELLQRLGSNHFVAVVGTSGSGKSSLVRCGLLSELLGGRMLDAGAAWEIAVTHPGGNPLALLTDSLLDAGLYDRDVESVRENLLATLSRSHFGLVEAVKQADIGEGTNFLLVVDQFEEIFRFNEAGQRQQEVANEFVSLLLEAAAQKDVPIYVVLTMRSDFIGECGQFEGLAEMVNRGEFLIPRLTREQFKRVIEGPIKVAGGKIAPRLLQRLLNDLGQQADQLPCLQHALMRTWDVWTAQGATDALDLDDYQRVGRMSQALSLHADEIYESLANDRQRELCKGIFQALTVEESNNRGIRRPQRLGRLCQILEVGPDELSPIINAYRQSGVTFLMPSPDVELTDQTIIDISHESLMRVWTRLRQWVEEETQAAGIYHRLSESADLHEQNKAGLYRDPELGIALAWQESKRPNAAWAERYRPGFETAMKFLEASQQSSVAEEQVREAARQRELEHAQMLAQAERARAETETRAARRLRILLAGAAVVAVFAVGASLVAVRFWRDADFAKQTAQQNADSAKKEADRAATQEAAATQARRDSEENLARARGAIDDYLIKISESQLLATPGMQPLRADLLASASQFYEDMLKKDPSNPDLQAGLASAFLRVGLVRFDTGDLDQSAKLFDRATQFYTSALALQPGSSELRHGLANSWFMLSAVHLRTDEEKATDYAKRAARIWEALIQEGGKDLRFHKELARAYNLLGISGRDNESNFLAYQKSLSIRLSLISEHPNDVQLIHGLAESFGNIGVLIADPELGLQMSLRSIDYAERAHQLQPQNVEYASDLSGFYSSAAQRLALRGRNAEALDLFRREMEHIGKFVRGNPSVVAVRRLLRNTISYVATLAARSTEPAPYVQLVRECLALSTALPKESAEDFIIDAQMQSTGAIWLTTAQKKGPQQQLTQDESNERKALLENSLNSLRRAVALGVKDSQVLKQDPLLSQVRGQPGFNELIASLEGKNPTDTAAAKTPAAVQLTPDDMRRIEQDRATSYLSFGALETIFRRNERARRSLEQAVALRQKLADAEPANQERRTELGTAQSMLARLLWDEDHLATALKLFNLQTTSLEQNLQQTPDDKARQASLADHHRRMADSLTEVDLWDEAAPHVAAALKAPLDFTDSTDQSAIMAPALQLLLGNDSGYLTGRAQVLKKYGNDASGEQAARIARLYALRPIPADDVAPIVALAEKAQNSWHAYTYALVQYRAGRFDNAIRTIEAARKAKLYDQLHMDDFVLAMAHFQLGHHDQARASLKAVNGHTLKSLPLWMHYATNMLDVDWIVLRREAHELIDGSPYDTDDRLRRARAYSRLEEFEKAEAECLALLKAIPQSPQGHILLALCLAKLGRQEAAEQLDTAQKLLDQQTDRTGGTKFWQAHAETLNLLKRHSEASQSFRRAIAAQSVVVLQSPKSSKDRGLLTELYAGLGDALQATGQTQEAQAARAESDQFLKVFGLASGSDNVVNLLGDAGQNQESAPDELINLLDRLLAVNEKSLPENNAIRLNLVARMYQRRATLLQTANRPEQEILAATTNARKRFDQSLAADPLYVDAAGALAELSLSRSDVPWTPLTPTSLASKGGTTLTQQPDGSILASGAKPNQEVYTVVGKTKLSNITAVRLETIPHPSLPRGGSGRDPNGSFFLHGFSVGVAQPGKPPQQAPLPIRLQNAADTYHRTINGTQYSIQNVIDGQRSAWDLWPEVYRRQEAVFEVSPGLKTNSDLPLVVQLTFHGSAALGCFRVSVTDAPNAFQRDELRMTAGRLTDPWAKLGAAYAMQSRKDDAVQSFGKAISQPNGGAALAEGGWLTDEVLDSLQASHADAYASMLPAAASTSAERGKILQARNLYARLSKLQPENSQWPELTRQLRSGTLAMWSFDSGRSGWVQKNDCELSVQDGILTVRRTGNDPFMVESVSAPAGRNKVVLRYRAPKPFTIQVFWSDSTGGFSDSRHRDYPVPAAVRDWREISLPFLCGGTLRQLRLDPNTANEDPLEIDSIVLQQVNPVESWSEDDAYVVRKALLDDITPNEDWLSPLIKLHPDDPQLQLALARKFAARGKLALASAKPVEALADLKQARDIWNRLSAGKVDWTVLTPVDTQTKNGSHLQLQQDGSIFVRQPADNDTFTLEFQTALKGIKGLRLEALADPRLPNGGPGWSGNFVLNDLALQARPSAGTNPPKSIDLQNAMADFSQVEWDVSGAADHDVRSGWGVHPKLNQNHTAVFEIADNLGDGEPTRLTIRLDQTSAHAKHILGRFRLSVTTDEATLLSTHIGLDWNDAELSDLNLALTNTHVALARAHAREGRLNESLAAFSEAVALAPNRAATAHIINEAASFDGLLQKLADRLAENGPFLASLTRYYRERGNDSLAEASGTKAREVFERQIVKEPENSASAEELAELLLATAVRWKVLQPVEMTSQGGEVFTVESDGSIFVSGPVPNRAAYTIKVRTDLPTLTAIRLESIPDARLVQGAGRNDNGNFHVGEFSASYHSGAVPDQATPLLFVRAFADFPASEIRNSTSMIDGKVETRWDTYPMHLKPHAAVFSLKSPAKMEGGFVTVTIDSGVTMWVKHGLGHFRLLATDDPVTVDREQNRLAVMRVSNAWAKLAAAYSIHKDQPALDQLLQRYPFAAVGVADLYATEQNWEQAIATYNKAITPDTKDAALFAGRAEAHQKLEHWDLAIADWTNADLHSLDKTTRYGDPSLPAMEQRANLHGHLQQWDQQVLDFTEMLKPERFGNNPWFFLKRGEAYDRLKSRDNALADFDQAIKLSSAADAGTYHFYRACHLAARGNWRQAADAMRLCYAKPADFKDGAWPRSDWWGYCNAALIFGMAGDVPNCKAAAAGLYQKYATAQPNDWEIRWVITSLLLQPGMINGDNRPRLLELAGKMDDYWKPRLTATIHFRSGEYQKAAELFDAHDPGNQFWHLAAMNYHHLGNSDRARQLLGRGDAWIQEQLAKDEGPIVPAQYANWWDWVGEVAVQTEATDLILGPIAGEPKKLAVQGQLAEAANAYAKALTDAPDQNARWRILNETARFDGMTTKVHILNSDWKHAAASFTRDLETNASVASNVWMLGPILCTYSGDVKKHQEICRKMDEHFQKSDSPADGERTLKMMLLADSGVELPPELVKKFVPSSEITSDSLHIWFSAARALLECRRGDYAEAHKWVDKTLELEKKSPNGNIQALALSVRALTYAKQKDHPQARTTLQEVKETLTTRLHLKWNADGTVDGTTILNGTRIEHDRLIPEILRREVEQLLKASSD